MKLIDADALKTKCGEWYTEEGTEEGFIGTLGSLLDDAPTVDVIPVEWLKNRREGLIFAAMTKSNVYGDNTIELCHAVNMVLDMWHEEQEAR